MAKLTLNNITAGLNAATLQNANNDLIEAALENTISRDGSSPNAMAANLDMGTHEILNVSAPTNNSSAARLQDILDASDLGASTAALTTIEDSGGYYASGNVEGALQEIADGSALPVASTTVQGIVELATDAETQALVDTSRAVTPSSLGATVATDTSYGIIRIATEAEALLKNNNELAITPNTVAPGVTGYLGGRLYSVYTKRFDNAVTFNALSSITIATTETIGPTGSTGNGTSPHNVWSALDGLPSGTTAVYLRFSLGGSQSVASGVSKFEVYAGSGDRTASWAYDATYRKTFYLPTPENFVDEGEYIVPVNLDNEFYIYYQSSTTAGTYTPTVFNIDLLGFVF